MNALAHYEKGITGNNKVLVSDNSALYFCCDLLLKPIVQEVI